MKTAPTQPQPADDGRCKGCGALFAHKPDCPGESAAEIAVAEIRALHTEKLDHHFHAGEFFSQCAACGPKVRYPCATVQALDKAGCP